MNGLSRLSQFRVQFVCKNSGFYGNNGLNGRFFGLFLDKIDNMDAKIRCGWICQWMGCKKSEVQILSPRPNTGVAILQPFFFGDHLLSTWLRIPWRGQLSFSCGFESHRGRLSVWIPQITTVFLSGRSRFDTPLWHLFIRRKCFTLRNYCYLH